MCGLCGYIAGGTYVTSIKMKVVLNIHTEYYFRAPVCEKFNCSRKLGEVRN
jgi:hypothetical protein